MKFSRQHPGFPVSTAAHVGLLAATLIAFAQTPKFEEAQETVPIEVVSDQQLNQIMKGEKTAATVKPAQRAEKVSEQVETHPTPPKAEAKRDVPTPPPSFKRLAEPSDDDAPQKQAKKRRRRQARSRIAAARAGARSPPRPRRLPNPLPRHP